ncbi:MOSC domain-containing protein [Lentibacter sp.]|uniref:MOSC domain-containing protein n=1 Tax=Lentibacter sp. TaxID=2024994 RepID=UPI003F6953DA
MPALKPSEFKATIKWIGRVEDRAAGLRSVPLERAMLGFAGLEGEAHGGVTRASCSRVTSQHPKGTEIANVRQISVLSAEEMALIAADLGLEALAPEYLGASLIIEGIPDLTLVPPSSRLQAPSGATLVIDMENRPCVWPAKEVEAEHAGHGKAFVGAAKNRRGVTAWVERGGEIALGDELVLHIPDQPVWPHLAQARGE